MVLKESYTYMNYLKNLMSQIDVLISNTEFTTTKERKHNIKEAYTNGNDKTEIVKTMYSDLPYTPNDILDLYVKILDEIEGLTYAIEEAKSEVYSFVDADISLNKLRHNMALRLSILERTKASEKEYLGTGHIINNEGNQVPLKYTVKEITTINYDRNKVKKTLKKLRTKSDEISLRKDLFELQTEVDFKPKFEIDTTLEDILSV